MKRGFTLAELLITIAIIGLVAVITIPTLVNDVRQKIFIAKWNKAYLQFVEVASLMSSDYEVQTFKDVLQAQQIADGQSVSQTTTKAAIHVFKKYFPDVKANCNGTCDENSGWGCKGVVSDYKNAKTGYKYLNGVDAGYWVLGYYPSVCFKTKDFVFALDTNTSNYGRISVDVNGIALPNVIGRDIFVLSIADLKSVKAGGCAGFFSTAQYACDKNAQYGGPGCSFDFIGKH